MTAQGHADNLRGVLFMVAAMAAFAFEDMFIKAASATLPVGQILILFGGGGTLAFTVLTLRRGERVFHPAILTRPILLRAASEVAGRLFFTLAIAFMPLSAASAILQATPLVVVAGAALLFGEAVGWRRWTAIFVGFAGVLVILRPGLEGFNFTSILAVLGMAGFAGRDLATRASPRVLSNMQLGVYGFAVMVPTGAALLAWSGGAVWPDGRALGLVGLATVIGVLAYYALTTAMRVGEVSVVTPFRYSRLLFAMVLGILVFGERPDAFTMLGSAIVLGAGLYTMLRERRRSASRV